MNSNRSDDALPVRELAVLVKDLHRPRPRIYWADLLCCFVAVHTGLYLSTPFPEAIVRLQPVALFSFAVSIFALYRVSYFNHEIAHQSQRLPGFELVWNLLVGIPLLIPSFVYSEHRNHHSRQGFGTASDAEYLAPRMRGIRGGLALLLACLILPAIYFLRFAVLTPAAWFVPGMRHWVDTHASSLGLLGLCRRPPPTERERPAWRLQEAACFCYLIIVATGLLLGIIPLAMVAQFYALMVGVLFLHGIRIMAGHRYRSDGSEKPYLEQVFDSFNFTHNRPLTWLMIPLGFHLHGLHHLFPSIPYHNMPEAQRRICAVLPETSPYRAIEATSYFREVWRFLCRRTDDAFPRVHCVPQSADEAALRQTTSRTS